MRGLEREQRENGRKAAPLSARRTKADLEAQLARTAAELAHERRSRAGLVARLVAAEAQRDEALGKLASVTYERNVFHGRLAAALRTLEEHPEVARGHG